MIATLLRLVAYYSGALGLYHRARNARTLTVIMFHRVLDVRDDRWLECDPDYSHSTDLFRESLAFFRRHYTVVSLDEVRAAVDGTRTLPPRALLITFDDGWADNVEYAWPELRQAGLPAALFVAAGFVGAWSAFDQDRVVAALRTGRLSTEALGRLLGEPAAHRSGAQTDWALVRALVARLESLDAGRRDAVLAEIGDALRAGRRDMVTLHELSELSRGGVAIGAHGTTHRPMTQLDDAELALELDGARRTLAAALGPDAAVDAMSFPHGRFDAAIARRAFESGYRMLFTSVPGLNVATGGPTRLLARIGFESRAMTGPDGRLRPDRLAAYLFRRAHVRLH